MNKRGFTLVELLAVIAVIALISMIAIPNIVSLSDNVKKDQMIDDAKKFISLAKAYVNANYEVRNSENDQAFSLEMLDKNKDIVLDPDGGNYSRNDSKVYYKKEDGAVIFCVKLIGNRRSIGQTECVEEYTLYSGQNVRDTIVIVH